MIFGFDPDYYTDLISGLGIPYMILSWVINLLLFTVFLKIALGWTDGSNKEFGTVFVTSLICSLCGLIPCLGCFLAVYIVSQRHDQTYGKAFGTYLLAALIPLVIVIIIIALLLGGFAVLFGSI